MVTGALGFPAGDDWGMGVVSDLTLTLLMTGAWEFSDLTLGLVMTGAWEFNDLTFGPVMTGAWSLFGDDSSMGLD